jgi:hypothetical protein
MHDDRALEFGHALHTLQDGRSDGLGDGHT